MRARVYPVPHNSDIIIIIILLIGRESLIILIICSLFFEVEKGWFDLTYHLLLHCNQYFLSLSRERLTLEVRFEFVCWLEHVVL